MHFQKLFLSTLILLLALFMANAHAQDSPDTADHPVVSRYAGSIIDGQQVLDFLQGYGAANNQGDYEYNMGLSARRANALLHSLNALTLRFR